jgi:hypothetical protein
MSNGVVIRAELIAEYKEVNANWRALADIRFKLLTFMSTLGSVAIYLVTRLQSESSGAPIGYALLLLISILGFLVTLGVTFYNQRNNELYYALIDRAKYLEGSMNLPSDSSPPGGQFNERPPRGRKLFGFITFGHDTGQTLIYGMLLGAWFFPLVAIVLGRIGWFSETRNGISFVVAILMSVVFTVELHRQEGTVSWLRVFRVSA